MVTANVERKPTCSTILLFLSACSSRVLAYLLKYEKQILKEDEQILKKVEQKKKKLNCLLQRVSVGVSASLVGDQVVLSGCFGARFLLELGLNT